MTSESVTKEVVVVLGSGSPSAVENASIADQKVSKNSENGSAMKNFVDIHERKVLDEEFRLAVEKMSTGIATIPNNWNDLTVRAQRNWVYKQVKNHCGNFPESLLALLVGSAINITDCNRVTVAEYPVWLDHEKFQRGQRFAMDHYAGISMAKVLSLFTLFSFEHGLKPLIVTGKSSDPFTSFKRYLSTGRCVKNWYSSNVWTEGTEAYKDMLMMCRMHAKGVNQTEMAGTQFGFMGLVILYPERFGIHGASDQDLDAYCHVWRGLGYLLGIEDEFNFCNGTLEEIKQRSRDFLECWVKPNLRDITPEWEHLIKSVMEGTKDYSPIVTYEHTLLYLADMINIPMPRLRSSLNYSTWIRFYIMEFLFSATARIPGSMSGMDRAIKMRI